MIWISLFIYWTFCWFNKTLRDYTNSQKVLLDRQVMIQSSLDRVTLLENVAGLNLNNSNIIPRERMLVLESNASPKFNYMW